MALLRIHAYSLISINTAKKGQKMGISGSEYELSGAQIEAFARDGYLTLDNFLTEEELAPIEAIYDRFRRGEVEGMGRDFCDMSGPYSRAFEDYNLINAMLPRVYAPELQGNIYEQRATSVARQLIGDDCALDYDQFLSKRPKRSEAVFAWHQDLGYWPTGTPDNRTTTCSLALDDADEENGCLRVVPGSHKEPSIRGHQPTHRTNPDTGEVEVAHALTIELNDDDEVVYLPVKRGSITVHDERIVHGSAGNRSDNWRRTYVVAHRSEATVAYERSIGFNHSHNNERHWETHLDVLRKSS